MIYLYVFAVAGIAVGLEFYMRISNLDFWHMYPFIVVAQLPLSFAVYKVVTLADTYTAVIILLPLGTMTVRMFVAVALFRELPSLNSGLALGLVVLANVLRTFKVF